MHPDPVLATREVIAPLTGRLLGMIILPGRPSARCSTSFPSRRSTTASCVRLLTQFLTHPSSLADVPFPSCALAVMHVYPSFFALAGAVRSAIVLGIAGNKG